MRHDQLALEISGLIRQEDYDGAQQLLPAYVGAVTEECLDQEDFLAARTFLKSACDAVKIRRAHYVRGLASLECHRAYNPVAGRSNTIDYTG